MRRSTVLRSAFCSAALLAMSGALTLPSVGAAEPVVPTTSVVAVEFGAEGWRYQEVATETPYTALDVTALPDAGFAAPDHADAHWSVGQMPFGNLGDPCGFPAKATGWDPYEDLLVRRPVALPAGARNLRVLGTVDNDAAVYVNGSLIGVSASGKCFRNSIDMAANDSLLQPMTVLAVRAHDYGVATFLDLRVVYDMPSDGIPPVLTGPGDLTVDATSAAGAAVAWQVQAHDAVDGAVAVSCTPASSSFFPVGDSTVTCKAVDLAGNTARHVFTVRVRSAAEQMQDLLAEADAVPGMAAQVRGVMDKLADDRPEPAAQQLLAVRAHIVAQEGTRLTAEHAAALLAEVDRILAALGR